MSHPRGATIGSPVEAMDCEVLSSASSLLSPDTREAVTSSAASEGRA